MRKKMMLLAGMLALVGTSVFAPGSYAAPTRDSGSTPPAANWTVRGKAPNKGFGVCQGCVCVICRETTTGTICYERDACL